MDIATILIQVLNGIQYGVIMALLATGLSLIFGMLGIINFAHGSLYMVGAYFTWTALNVINIPGGLWVAILFFVIPAMALLGFIIERLLLRKMYGHEAVYQLLLTFGLLLVLQQGVAIIYGSMPLFLGIPEALRSYINLVIFKYPAYRLVVTFISLALIFSIWLFIERSFLGAIIRASVEDPETARTLGINTNKVYALTFALGSVLAGLGGALHTPMTGGLQHYIGSEILLVCFIVVVIGGMGSIRGALLGGLILGVVRGIAAFVWPPISDFIMFVIMGLILLIRPQGLMGRTIAQ